MKKILTIALLFIGASMFAQTATKTQTTTTQTTTANGTKAKSITKSWTLSMTENFGDQHKPNDTQKNDLLNLMADGRYRLIMNGVAEGGTWTLSKDNLWITLTTDAGAVKKLKVLESSETTLKVDYRDADEVHNVLIYSVTAATGGRQ
jgi:hypothetical protein